MEELVSLGRKIIESGNSMGIIKIDAKDVDNFLICLEKEDNATNIVSVMEHDLEYKLPYKLVGPIERRLNQLHYKTPFTLRWIAAMLRFYDYTNELVHSDELYDEAEDLEQSLGK
jgi:hypothetical protein